MRSLRAGRRAAAAKLFEDTTTNTKFLQIELDLIDTTRSTAARDHPRFFRVFVWHVPGLGRGYCFVSRIRVTCQPGDPQHHASI